MSYGLKRANNKMAMARGAKFMHVHNLPGWYNKEGDLFGQVPEKESKEIRALKYKLRRQDAKVAIAKMKELAAEKKSTDAHVKAAFLKLKVKAMNAPKVVGARQSGVRVYNRLNLTKSFKAAIGPNTTGLGWAKVKNSFFPLIGTRKKGGGYVVNMSGMLPSAKYNNVVKGIYAF